MTLPPASAPVGQADLGDLTPPGLTAFAARAARRALALYAPTTDFDRTAREHFDNAVGYAEAAARGQAAELPGELLDELFALADRVADTSGFAPFAAVHAARVASRSVGGASAHLELVTSAFGAARVLYTAVGEAGEPAVTRALRADLDALPRHAADPRGGVDPSDAGPLGPAVLG